MFRVLLGLCFLSGLSSMALAAKVENPPPVQYLQVYLGAMQVNNDTVSFQTPDNGKATSDEFPDDLPWFGGVVQTPHNQGRHQYGIESGGFISWDDSDTDFAFINGTTFFKVETSLLLFDLFLGAYVSTYLSDLVRLHVGAGPMLLYGRLKLNGDKEEDENEKDEGNRVVIVSGGTRIVLSDDDTDSDLVFGGYVRFGIDLQWDKQNAFGLSARYIHAELDLDDSLGRVAVKGPQVFLTFTRRY